MPVLEAALLRLPSAGIAKLSRFRDLEYRNIVYTFELICKKIGVSQFSYIFLIWGISRV